jgi:hypothetical protein
MTLTNLQNHYHQQDKLVFGLYNQLNHIRYESDFILPLFADFSTAHTADITCGSSRFLAYVSCGVSAEEIRLVFQVKKGHSPTNEMPNCILLTSTGQAEHLLGIDSTEYEIVFKSRPGPMSIESSLISSSVFNLSLSSNVDTLVDRGTEIFNFWNRFIKNQKINITVTCNPDCQNLIKWASSIFNVNIEYHQLSEAGTGYSAVMQKFNKITDNKLHLWVYNITETLYLEYLLPWVDQDTCWYHTQSKNLHLFETTRGPEKVLRKMIGNFVK